ncbi:TrbC/VirB2 family protein [Maridesulfovibrio hydrothermalis]|uniref:TrbC/VIRB2 family protein n=1 Tax=Maridesulfovibrio hydrothermalis AM13 = DSM 14728 TaxID=1121451 RepID=L0REP0_9BACT|nr:TrbC/VirB2 family protein [Maridesulfovibrio hydrothermalis]CCO22289.1 TrbC/VIRB2 family protein [Maridesulfovibrio hydrothermalis AM13 = DSM 14728]CCO24011.1 TrbC/VIRB2 family protein [Maridesulfovibrio hydrothermalis AM13 = DSM 14728]
MKKNNLLLLLAMTAIVVIPEPALASTTISQFNTPFENFVGLLTGPVGKFMSIGGMAGVGLLYVFQREEITGIMRTALGVVFAICFIAFSTTIVENGWTFSGAVL